MAAANTTNTAQSQSEAEAMAELARLLWERYFKGRAERDLLSHALNGYKAEVTANNGDGTITVMRPFDQTEITLHCPPALADEAQTGDQVLVVTLGDWSNAFVLCKTDMGGLSISDPRVSELNFSNIDAGFFSVTWEDGVTNDYTVTRDGSGRITSVTNTADGFTTEVIWE